MPIILARSLNALYINTELLWRRNSNTRNFARPCKTELLTVSNVTEPYCSKKEKHVANLYMKKAETTLTVLLND